MKKAILMSILLFPMLSLANLIFISQGASEYCSQELYEAIETAQKNADSNAKKFCGEVNATRVSKFHKFGTGSYCIVRLQASYVCQ